jgi:hypothetical protein
LEESLLEAYNESCLKNDNIAIFYVSIMMVWVLDEDIALSFGPTMMIFFIIINNKT